LGKGKSSYLEEGGDETFTHLKFKFPTLREINLYG
jgi:hypothetical protein